MTQISVKERIPGANAAQSIMAKLIGLGIHDVKLLYDDGIKPYGMWAVTQIEGRASGLILLPKSYNETKLKPYILWWCKDEQARFREPNEQDLVDIIKMVQRAPAIWEKGEKRADKFDEQDVEKDRKHKERLKGRVHQIAPAMKKALKAGNL